jgi:outer membrane lipoprotein-sorting protein
LWSMKSTPNRVAARWLGLTLCIIVLACTEKHGSELGAFTSISLTAGDKLLSTVAAHYATASSYTDKGVVTTTFHSPKTWVTRKPFATRFSRTGGLFRFEFRDRFLYSSTHYVVWAEGNNIRSWWTIRPQIARFASISEAIAGPSGVSGGSAHTIPTLLLGTPACGWRITNLRTPHVLGEQLVSQRNCYVVEGLHPRQDTQYRLWIDEHSLAILRIQSNSRLSDGTDVETITTYSPTFGAEVTATDVRFRPPHQLRLPGCGTFDLPI